MDVENRSKQIREEEIEILRGFHTTKNLNQSIQDIIERICALFTIDRCILMGQVDMKQIMTPVLEYSLQNGVWNWVQKSDVIGDSLYLQPSEQFDNVKQDFIQLIQKQAHYTKQDLERVSGQFEAVGYTIDLNQVQEIVVYLIQVEEHFSYIVFEKKQDDAVFTSYQNEILFLFIEMIGSYMKQEKLKNLFFNERKIKNEFVKHENMPFCIVEKETNRVLYFNELYQKVMPEIQIGGIFDNIMDKKNKHMHCTIDCEQLEQNSKYNGNYWIKKCIPLELENGKEVYLMYAKDINDYVEQLDVMDLLTSSLSAKGLTEYYNREIKTNDKSYVLVSIDIDKFKYINNKLGFTAGDNILKQTAITIRNTLEQEEMFCRINEDRFAILFQFDSMERVNEKFNTIQNNFLEMQETHFPDTRLKYIGGVTIVDKEVDFNILLDQSNTARKSIKGSHTSNFAMYTTEAEKKVQKELLIEQRMASAVQNDEFIAYLQPKFDLQTKKICGAEALVRWITPEGMIFPDEFIPLFEKNGFIRELDFIIYEKVMKYIRDCLDRDLPVYPISLNVSRSHIQDKNFMTKILDLVQKYDISIDLLELEVTESVFVEDKEVLKEFIDNIKAENFMVSIDDFGTAYSSLHVLTDVHVDVLKIDKGFLQNVQRNEKQQEISKDEIVIKNIIHMAKELGFQVICEGVETDEQIELLKNIGCELGQGYVFAKPMPMHDYEEKFLI